MTAVFGVPVAPVAKAAPPMPQPLYLAGRHGPLFAWFHAPAVAGPAPLAVLICAPLGHEDLATHRSLRRLAIRLAEAGLPVLRYDHPGSGDSGDVDDPDTWLPAVEAAVHEAADALRRLGGAARLVLLGLRMGALLAARAAAGRDDVEALVGLLPVASGRAWLRECRLLDGRSIATAVVRADPAEGVDLGGLALGPGPAQALAALEWPPGEAAGAAAVLLVERDDLPGRLADALGRGGQAVEVLRLPSLDRVIAVAHLSHTPDALFDEVTAWVARRLPPRGPAAAPVSPPSVGTPSVRLGGVTESLVHLRRSPALVAVLSASLAERDAAPARRGVVLLSSGAERRVGPNRLWVPFARARAARGDVVLRLDMGGIGDSDARTTGHDGEVYDRSCVDDVAEAVAWLRREHGVGPCLVAGVCSGGYHAWRAALGTVDCTAVVAINPLVFHWREGMSLDPSAHAFGRVAVASGAMRSLRDPKRWLKLLRGQANLGVIASALTGRARDALTRQRRRLGRGIGRPRPDDLAADLRQAVHRGVRPCFVFADHEPGLHLLAEEGGTVFRQLQRRGQVEVHHLPGADHTLSHLAARRALWQRLDELIDRLDTAP